MAKRDEYCFLIEREAKRYIEAGRTREHVIDAFEKYGLSRSEAILSYQTVYGVALEAAKNQILSTPSFRLHTSRELSELETQINLGRKRRAGINERRAR